MNLQVSMSSKTDRNEQRKFEVKLQKIQNNSTKEWSASTKKGTKQWSINTAINY